MEIKRGLFIVLEGFDIEKIDEITKGVSAQFSKVKIIKSFNQFQLLSQQKNNHGKKNIPEDIETKIKIIEEQSPKLAIRASFMIHSMERWEKRNELLEAIKKYQLIIINNYCYNDIINTFTREEDIKWGKTLFTGLLRPDRVFYKTNDAKKYKTIYKEIFLKEITSQTVSEQINDIINGINDLQTLYSKFKPEDNETNINVSNLNFYPSSIGEDLFL